MMDLRHYASAPVALDNRAHEQTKGMKPNGLWVSAGTAWLDWCRSEEFRTNVSWHEQAVDVAPEANVLTLPTEGAIDRFTADYGKQVSPTYPSYYIDWELVASEYDGILISPYQWTRRNEPHTFWYYGWDVASGCIWNPAVISLGEAVEVSFEAVDR